MAGRDESWTITAVEMDPRGPHMCPDNINMLATVYVNERVNNHLPNLYAQIAHEVVHMLNPGPSRVNYLEEGVACMFQDQIVLEIFGEAELRRKLDCRDSGYRHAKTLAMGLQEINGNAFTDIRARLTALHQATAPDLIDLFTAISEDDAEQLCALCDPRD